MFALVIRIFTSLNCYNLRLSPTKWPLKICTTLCLGTKALVAWAHDRICGSHRSMEKAWFPGQGSMITHCLSGWGWELPCPVWLPGVLLYHPLFLTPHGSRQPPSQSQWEKLYTSVAGTGFTCCLHSSWWEPPTAAVPIRPSWPLLQDGGKGGHHHCDCLCLRQLNFLGILFTLKQLHVHYIFI